MSGPITHKKETTAMKTISISQWVAAVNSVAASRQSAAISQLEDLRRSTESPLRSAGLNPT